MPHGSVMCRLFRSKQTVASALLAWYVVSGLPVSLAGAARNTTAPGVCCCSSLGENSIGGCCKSNRRSARGVPAPMTKLCQCCRSSLEVAPLDEVTEAGNATRFHEAEGTDGLANRATGASERDSRGASPCCRESDTTVTEVCQLSCNCGCRDKQQQADAFADGRVTLQVTGVVVYSSPVCEFLFATAEPECRRLFYPPSTPPG
jgi:hypothetical protein